MELFNTKFDKFKDHKDKFDSLYIFVVYDAHVDSVKEKLNRYMDSLDKISDNVRRSYAKNRIFVAQQYVDSLEGTLNCILMIGKDIEMIQLEKEWKDVLRQFMCPNIQIRNGNEYDINWLKDLILDTNFVHVLHLKGNDIRHYYLNSTKKAIVYSDTIKSMKLENIISGRLPKNEKYVIHGVSVVLKNFTDNKALLVSTKELKDEEILIEVDNSMYREVAEELDDWLKYITNDKYADRIVFGKDIEKAMHNRMLKTLYCTKRMETIVNTRIPKELHVFEIKLLKKMSDGDTADMLDKNYKGAVGITFY